MNGTTERLPQDITPQEFRHEQHPDLHFDKYQFDDRKSLARSISKRLGTITTIQSGMQFFRARTVKHIHWRAQWANNETQLRRVIAKRAASWCGHKHFDGIADLPELIRLCAAKVERIKAERGNSPARRESVRKQLETIEKFGGYLQFITAIAWASYRRGLKGIEIAAEMEITPRMVRTHLLRLNEAAARLGFPTHVRHHTAGKLRKHAQLLKKRASMGYTVEDKIEKLHYTERVHTDVLKMISQKWTGKEICARLRCCHQDLTACYRRGLVGKFATDRRRANSGRPLVYTPEIHAEVIRLRKAGNAWAEVAKVLDKGFYALRAAAFMRQAEWGQVKGIGNGPGNVKGKPRPNKRRWYTPEIHEEVTRLRKAGKTWAQISKKYAPHLVREANYLYRKVYGAK